MTSWTEQPQLFPSPNLEPPSFGPLRDLFAMKLIQEQANPYGFDPSSGQSMQSLYTGYGRPQFNPYTGGYGGGGGGDIMSILQQLLGGMGGRTPRVVSRGGGMLPNESPNNPMPGWQRQAPAPRMPNEGFNNPMPGGGATMRPKAGGYGFDGCELGHDGCMGHDAIGHRAPMSPPQPGNTRPMRPSGHQMGSAAHRAIMAALMQKLARPRQIGMDASDQRQPTTLAGMGPTAASTFEINNPGMGSNPAPGAPAGATSRVFDVENRMNQNPRPWSLPIGSAPTQRSTIPGMGSQPSQYPGGSGTYAIEQWFSGGMPPTGLIGHDSPYMFQRGPMSPLGMDSPMDAPGPGLPGPYASNFPGGAPPSSALAAITALLSGGGSTAGGAGGLGGGMGFRRKPRPLPGMMP